ncbi:alpha/beta fold hydrolase [Aquipuribacter sp. SD81]|uniref:alpha/beta fold hydrolase n=1 Tax=Aquipuribacter sp. SD81 TaxID=3127703 RepID=UPI0030163385
MPDVRPPRRSRCRDVDGRVLAIAAVIGVTALVVARRLATARLRHDGQPPGVRADDGVLLHTEVDENTTAPVTVVLSHGFAVRAEAFAPLRRALGPRARLVLVEHRGHHRSGWAGRRRIGLRRLGRDLGAVVDACADGRPVVLVGHSLGALAALALAGDRPELFGGRVRGVALLSGSSGLLPAHRLPRLAMRAVAALRLRPVVRALVWLLSPLADLVPPTRLPGADRAVRRFVFGPAPVAPGTVAEAEEMWRRTPKAQVAQLLPRALFFDSARYLDVLSRVPTLVLSGAADAVFPARHARALAAGAGDRARLVLVDGGGHMVPLSHPEPVAAALEDLLTRVEADLGGAAPRADGRGVGE